MNNDIGRARDALNAIPPDLPRDEWVRAGMAAQDAGLDFDAFDAWSSQAGNYRASDCRDTWRSFKPGKGVGAGTLFGMARDHGWTDGTPRHNDADLSGFLHKAPRKPQEAPRKPALVLALPKSGAAASPRRMGTRTLQRNAPPGCRWMACAYCLLATRCASVACRWPGRWWSRHMHQMARCKACNRYRP